MPRKKSAPLFAELYERGLQGSAAGDETKEPTSTWWWWIVALPLHDICTIESCGLYCDQDLASLEAGLRHVRRFENFWPSSAIADDALHTAAADRDLCRNRVLRGYRGNLERNTSVRKLLAFRPKSAFRDLCMHTYRGVVI